MLYRRGHHSIFSTTHYFFRKPWSVHYFSVERNRKILNPEIAIRSETEADIGAIHDVTMAAFKRLEISHHTEQFIIAALREAKALTVSRVAEMDGRVLAFQRAYDEAVKRMFSDQPLIDPVKRLFLSGRLP